MKTYKGFVLAGGITIGISLLALLYNFFGMYSIPGKCPGSVDTHPCQAYDNWILLNKISLAVLAVGLVIIAVGLVLRHQKKS